MKNLFFFIFVLTVQISTAQDVAMFEKQNALKISPIAMGQSEFQLSYERYFNNRNSSLSIIPSIILRETNEETKKGFQIMSQYRFYLNHINKTERKTFLNFHNYGLYSGVYVQYLNYEEDYLRGYYDDELMEYINQEFNKQISAYEGGAIVGLQIDVTTRIIMDFYVGGGIRYTDIVDEFDETSEFPDYYETYGVFDVEYQGVKPKIGFQVGISF